MDFPNVRIEHRAIVEKTIRRLYLLHGSHAPPREHKVFETGANAYELRVYAYPLGITARHLEDVEALPHVTSALVSFHAHGGRPDTAGAIIVQLQLEPRPAAHTKRDIADSDADWPSATRPRHTEPAAHTADNEPSWIQRMQGRA